jgi:hypothetical protein
MTVAKSPQRSLIYRKAKQKRRLALTPDFDSDKKNMRKTCTVNRQKGHFLAATCDDSGLGTKSNPQGILRHC